MKDPKIKSEATIGILQT